MENALVGGSAIRENEVLMVEASRCETFRCVLRTIQPHNGADIVLPEIRKVFFRCVDWITFKASPLMRPTAKENKTQINQIKLR